MDQLRVEIDGSKTALWVGADKVAEKPSNFRPCDVFPGGKEKRNFLAASRDGSGHFKGIIDRVVVYHTVHEVFAKLPEPTQDAPRRPTLELIEKIAKGYGNVEELNRKISTKAQERNWRTGTRYCWLRKSISKRWNKCSESASKR